MCEKHLSTPKGERQKLLATWKASHGGGGAPAAKPGKRGRRGGRRGKTAVAAA
jgi:hypothetical protein